MQYLELTQHTNINHITSISRIEEEKYVRLDGFTIRSLEILSPMQKDGTSLLNIIDRTITPMGGRLMRRWLVFPLKDKKPIDERLDIVDYYFHEPDFRQCIDEQLHRICDLERIVSKVAVGRASPREIVQLKISLNAIKSIKSVCLSSKKEALKAIGEQLNLCEYICERIEREIKPDPALLTNKGNFIAQGFNKELDELRSIRDNSKQYLLEIQEKEAQLTGCLLYTSDAADE